MNPFITKESLESLIDPIEDIIQLEVGWYWRVISINRATGRVQMKLAKIEYLKPSLLDRIKGKKKTGVIFV